MGEEGEEKKGETLIGKGKGKWGLEIKGRKQEKKVMTVMN